jgi:hypothetical protein
MNGGNNLVAEHAHDGNGGTDALHQHQRTTLNSRIIRNSNNLAFASGSSGISTLTRASDHTVSIASLKTAARTQFAIGSFDKLL